MPDYFTTLRPYRNLFTRGVPTLMYHKLGPRPAAARLKFLYVSCALFDRQLRELKAAGFHSASCDASLTAKDNSARAVVLTFDDGFENVLRHGLEPLRRHGFKAIQFLVPGLFGKTNEWETRNGEAPERIMDVPQAREWLAAGHEIGAHTMTHPNLARIPFAEAREQIFASKKSLEDTFQVPVKHFAYPYGGNNERVREIVQEAGFVTACTTVPGVNLSATPADALNRFTARYASRKLVDLWRHYLAPPL